MKQGRRKGSVRRYAAHAEDKTYVYMYMYIYIC